MKEFPSVTLEAEVNPVPLIVNVCTESDPVTGFGLTLVIVVAVIALAP